MRRATLRKILYSALLLGFYPSLSMPSYSNEIVYSNEIKTLNQEYDSKDEVTVFDNRLGGEYYEAQIKKDKPEFSLRNWGDILKERRQKKEAAKQAQNEAKEKENSPIADIACEYMNYNSSTNEIEAINDVVITSKSGTKVRADKAVFNRSANTIKLFNNISLEKNGATITGDYMFIDLNEENAIADEPVTSVETLVITSQEGYILPDRIEYENGQIQSSEKIEMELKTGGFETYGRSLNDKRLVDFSLKQDRSKPYTFKAKQIVIRPEKDHDSMVVEGMSIYYKDKKILDVPTTEIFQDKEMTYTEVNFPLEAGSIKGLGMYAGLGYTFKLPKAHTLRLTAIGSNSHGKIGAGGIAHLKSKRMSLAGAWTSNTHNLIVDGSFKVTNRLTLDIGRHAYKNEWLGGGNRAGYIAELNYDDSYIMRDLENTRFRHRFSAGYVADYKRSGQNKHMKDGFRYRYQAELSNMFKTYGSTEQDMYMKLGAVAQTMATVYSETGDTNAFFRMGPVVESRCKRWFSSIVYTMGGVHGKSPYKFDEYRYGRQTVSFDESLILNKYLSLGYKGTLSFLKDNAEKDLLTENRFYAVAGPEDVKVAVSFDAIRDTFTLDFLFLLGTNKLKIDYDKLIINNPDEVGKRKKKITDKELYRVKVPKTEQTL